MQRHSLSSPAMGAAAASDAAGAAVALPRRRGQVLGQQLGHPGGVHVAVGVTADAHHRSQGAAAQAGRRLDGEEALGVGVLPFPQAELVAQLRQGVPRAPQVAGRARADLDEVPAHGAGAEARVEAQHLGEPGRGHPRVLPHRAQRLLREEAQALLQRKQGGDQGRGAAGGGLHDGQGVAPLELVHGPSSMQKRCSLPRR